MIRRMSCVLVVEDDENHLELIRRAFQLANPSLEIIGADSLSLAIDMIRLGEPAIHFIIADWRLPDGEGTDLLSADLPSSSLPIVLLTARGNERLAVDALKRGALDYVVKSESTILQLPFIIERAWRQWCLSRERSEVEERLRESEERYALAIRGSNDGIWDWNIAAGRFFVSARWREQFGYSQGPFPSTFDEWASLIHPSDAPAFHARLQAHIEGRTAQFEFEHRIINGAGEYCWLLTRGIAVRESGGKANRLSGSMTDITARKRIEEQLAYSAFHDSLTGLYNRTIFIEQLQLRMRLWLRNREDRFAILYLDFDRFKFINDTLGQSAGDRFLTDMAGILRRNVRESDVVARFGGDEFAILLQSVANAEEAQRIAARILSQLKMPVTLEGRTIYPSVSIGVAVSGPGCPQAQDLLRAADSAMYAAKMRGGLCYADADGAMISSAHERMAVEHGLRRAVAEEGLRLAWQPVYQLASRRVVALEGLLRWQPEEGEERSAASFLPIAETVGLAVDLDRWTLREAARSQAAWTKKLGRQVPCSVNVSANFLASANAVDELERTLNAARIGKEQGQSWLTIEVAERALLGDDRYIESLVRELKRLRIGIWLDDFGLGFVALSHLSLPVDRLKMDPMFTARLLDSDRDRAVVKSILALADSLSVGVIAEGVETEQQRQMLQSLGCGFGQGYHLCRPISHQDVDKLILAGGVGWPAGSGT